MPVLYAREAVFPRIPIYRITKIHGIGPDALNIFSTVYIIASNRIMSLRTKIHRSPIRMNEYSTLIERSIHLRTNRLTLSPGIPFAIHNARKIDIHVPFQFSVIDIDRETFELNVNRDFHEEYGPCGFEANFSPMEYFEKFIRTEDADIIDHIVDETNR